MVWYCMVWHGMVWHGIVRYGIARQGMVWSGMVWHGMVRYGTVWYGTVRCGAVRYGMVSYGMACFMWCDMVWYQSSWRRILYVTTKPTAHLLSRFLPLLFLLFWHVVRVSLGYAAELSQLVEEKLYLKRLSKNQNDCSQSIKVWKKVENWRFVT